MEELSLSSLFENHLSFPAGGRARIGPESFCDRVTGRHLDFEDKADGFEAWLDHFFEQEHAFEERAREFEQLAVTTGDAKELSVVEFDLGEAQFVVLDSDDGEDVVVVSSQGAMVFNRSSELAMKLRAAEVPASRPSSNSPATSPSRAYHVRGTGGVATVDAKAVLAALKSAEVRTHAAPRLSSAPVRLGSLNATVTRPSPAAETPRSAAVQAVRQIARAERTAAPGAPRAVVFERGRPVREERGASARWWQRMASTATRGGARPEGRVGRASAVALGRETVALRAGGVTAVVQRPTRGLARTSSEATRLATSRERRVTRAIPSWVSEFVGGGRPTKASRFWIDPTSTTAAGRPSWVDSVMRQARDARSRAREEVRGHLDPPRIQFSTPPLPYVSAAPSSSSSTSSVMPSSRRSAADAGLYVAARAPRYAPSSLAELEFASSTRFESASSPNLSLPHVSMPNLSTPRAPLISAGAVPATALRALYDGIERTAVREGLRISSLRMDVDADHVAPVRAVVETVPAAAPAAIPVRTTIDVPTYAAPAQTARAFTAAPSLSAIFAAPFEDAGSIRVGPELSGAVARSLAGSMDFAGSMPTLVETVHVSGTPAHIRIEVPDVGRRAPAVAAAAPGSKVAGATAMSAFDLSGYGTLDWSSSGAPGVWVHPAAESAPRANDWVVAEGAFFAPASSRPALGMRAPVAALSFPLADVNAIRAPELSHAPPELEGDDEAGADVFSVPLPLHVQMAEAAGFVRRKARGERVATAEAHPASFSAPSQEVVAYGAAPASEGSFGPPASAGPVASVARGASAPGAASSVRPASSVSPSLSAPTSGVVVGPGRGSVAPSSASASSGAVAPAFAASSPAMPGPSGAAPSAASFSVSTGPASAGPAATGAAASSAPGASSDSGAARPKTISVVRPPREAAPDQVVVGRAAPAAAASASAGPSGEHLAGAPVRRKPRGEATATIASAASASPARLPSQPIIERAFGRHDVSHVQAYTSSSASDASRSIGASAYASGPELHFASGSAGPSPVAHEGMHVHQSGGRPSSGGSSSRSSPSPMAGSAPSAGAPGSAAPSVPSGRALTRRRGAAPLTFRYPTQTRWWAGAPGAAGKAPATGALATGNQDAALVTAPAESAAASAAVPAAQAPAGTRGTAQPVRVAASRRSGSSESASGSAGASASAAPVVVAGPSAPPAGSPSDGETAYVMVAPSGEARVVNAKGASAQKDARSRGAGVDMTVVAAVAPQAPSLEQMAAMPGHERPHAKGKKEGGGKAASTPKSDSLSLQGTVDSLAQRIYHRLKRRLAADRERFGG